MSKIRAKPSPIEIDLHHAVLVVIDMQNAYVSNGGMLDLFGLDISHVRGIVETINRLARAVRVRNVPVVWIATVNENDGSDTPGPDTGIWCKDTALCMYRGHPEWGGNLTFRGTWGAELVEGLEAHDKDIIFEKTRHSAFHGTEFDALLQSLGAKYLLFTGVATNICVEASIRDSYYRGYFPILISDATSQAGPPFTQQATEFNVVAVYGWVASSEDVVDAMRANA